MASAYILCSTNNLNDLKKKKKKANYSETGGGVLLDTAKDYQLST